ncbi:hypothetical protein SMAC4_13853 [Sordaria macrospora]|uniref:uncharacterized protein n=1 Tax=Sordaria macrospora TaxID=5147 RepID=UPI002B2EFDC7|nr:hypothetical protein SMAC4_13853 [Sordaria macrospora]
MIGGEKVLVLGFLERNQSIEEDGQDQADIDSASDGKNKRYLAVPNEAISRYHLALTVSTLRWLIFTFKAWKTESPPLCLSDSNLDPIVVGLIRQLHVLFRKEDFSSELMRGRRASSSRTPDENGRDEDLPLGAGRARRAKSSPILTENFDYHQEMLRLVREQPLISTSLQPSPAPNWNYHDHPEGEGWHQMEEEKPDPMELWKTEENTKTESEQGWAQAKTDVMEVCKTGEEEEGGNKNESRDQGEQAPSVKTEVIEVQPSSSSNNSDEEMGEASETEVEDTEMPFNMSRSSSFVGDPPLVQD